MLPPQIKDWGMVILFHFPSVNLGTMTILGKVPTMCQHHAGALLITELRNSPVHCSSERSDDSHQVTRLSMLSLNRLWSPGKMYLGTFSECTFFIEFLKSYCLFSPLYVILWRNSNFNSAEPVAGLEMNYSLNECAAYHLGCLKS